MKSHAVFLLISLLADPVQAAFREPSMVTASGVPLSLLSSDFEVDIAQDLASVRVTQVFQNDGEASDARYVFPLPHDAAVHRMVMKVGDEVVEAKIRRIQEAQQEFAQAKSQGKTAALLEEHRANVFSQDVANVPAGGSVRIEIQYTHAVEKKDGLYEVHIPMAIGPRYANGANGIHIQELDKALPVTAEEGTAPLGMGGSVVVRLRSGLPIHRLASPTHPIEVDQPSPYARNVMLASGRTREAKDFVLQYALSDENPQAGLVEHADDRGRFGYLMIEPPALMADDDVPPRELVFLMDASGSMNGEPLDRSKDLVSKMLSTLRPRDTFRIIVFGSSASSMSRKALEPTPGNLNAAREFLSELSTMGGTEIELGIRAAMEPEADPNRMRLVVFLTDGFIGSESSVLATLDQVRGQARVFSFGIGRSTNRWLLDELAIKGQGVSRILTSGVDAEAEISAAVESFAERLQTPALTDAYVDFGDCKVADVSPAGTFDVYARESIRVSFRETSGSCRKSQVAIVGRWKGKLTRFPVTVRELDRPSASVPLLWARREIAELMRTLSSPSTRSDAPRGKIVEKITELGLKFSLTTQWTGFVAVSEKALVAAAKDAVVRGPAPAPTSPSSFGGTSAPEPAEWAAMILMLVLLAWCVRFQRKEVGA